ncbi:hypothetical protein A2118_02030 [Candidatus Kaiserbacteria bacterium GWA2_50_9]|uniref:Glycosyl transferase family 1 domain-containing protein n=1 Tax=Candidatus Kaiserbacteria bacterium GWA2_50_9 TaxID=1798474 RepID=A0A1F6BUM2_9BACT|nr:MAG: hypothetical protein A2118_02030 [Candidatus Kaiserbacteria bacterium GWA2_50_9]
MRLLIVTQAVDSKDPILGFFVRWIAEFAKYAERIEIICLKEGEYALPANVHVYSLGKERAVSRLTYVVNFYRYIWSLRHDYDAVFVHMNPEYVVLGGLLWRLWGKGISLWYMHKSVNLKLRIAELFANNIFTASKESFRLTGSTKVHVMGHGIDTEIFSPGPGTMHGTAVLSVGRLSSIKRHDLIIRAAEHIPYDVWIVGDGPERQHLVELTKQLSLTKRVHLLGPQTQKQLPDLYRTAGIFVHTSETGSLDKVVLEALACGLPVITTNPALASLPVTVVSTTPNAIAKEVVAARIMDTEPLVSYVREHHSLRKLIPAIIRTLS